MSLDGQVALVTGSSRGLGLAIACALHNHGAKVVINYIKSDEKAQQVAAELGGIALKADVADLEAVKDMFRVAEEHFGQPVNIVVNNALADMSFDGRPRKIADVDWDDFEQQIRVTVRGTLNTTKAALPGFRKAHEGRIINIGTNLVQNPVVPYQSYTTAKGGMLALTHTMAAELGPENVTCNLVAGGLLQVTDASAATPDAVFQQIAAVTPLRRVTTPEDLAGAIVFFAGPLARAVTGQQLVVDGGLVMT